MNKISKFTRGLSVTVAAVVSLLCASAHATNDPNCSVIYTQIRGEATVNGVPTPGVKIDLFCCDTGAEITCTNADGISTVLNPDAQYSVCYPGTYTNYYIAFNSIADGGFCPGCTPIGGLHFGNYCPSSIFLRATYQNCTQYVSCEVISNAYFASQGCPYGEGWGGALVNVDIPCGSPPPCTNCVDSALGLGAAAGTSVLELGAAQVSITGPPGGIIGDIAIAPNGKLSLTGSEYVTGTIRLGAGATFANSSSGSIGGVQNNVDLTAQINAAYAANANDAALPCTQTFGTLNGSGITTITGGHGLNVICVKDISLSGKQVLLTGPSDAKFIFNITGKLVLTGGGLGPQIRVDASAGIQPSAVLYNLIGAGADVAFSGGGGGVSCCAAIVDGTILAPYRKIALSPGLVNGEVISGMNISIVSGSSVRCPPCP